MQEDKWWFGFERSASDLKCCLKLAFVDHLIPQVDEVLASHDCETAHAILDQCWAHAPDYEFTHSWPSFDLLSSLLADPFPYWEQGSVSHKAN